MLAAFRGVGAGADPPAKRLGRGKTIIEDFDACEQPFSSIFFVQSRAPILTSTPAAADTLLALFADTRTTPADYDAIVTGDLGQIGHDLLCQLMREQRTALKEERYFDCGLEVYDRQAQDVHAGGSGCGCSAVVLNALFLPKLQRGDIGRMIFMGTGALMSLTSSQQGESIPGIAHAVVLESPKMKG